MAKKRFVVINPPSDVDELEEIVKFGRDLQFDAPAKVNGVSLAFSAPEAGWIDMWLTVHDRTLHWMISDVCDPFALPREEDSDGLALTFLYWLEAIAGGRSPALACDMEGPVGALLVSGAPASPTVTLFAVAAPGDLEFAVSMDRAVLVRDIYAALIAYWEGDVLNSAWSEWSKLPKWSLRSSILDKYLG